MSDTAQDAGYQLSNYSATVYTNGKHPAKASAATLEALAYVLRVPLDEVRELAGMPPVHGKFELAPEADTLTAPQRTAVNEIIRLLADGNQKAGEGNADSSPSNTQAAGSAASRPDMYDLAADTGGESEGERLARESAELGEGPQ